LSSFDDALAQRVSDLTQGHQTVYSLLHRQGQARRQQSTVMLVERREQIELHLEATGSHQASKQWQARLFPTRLNSGDQRLSDLSGRGHRALGEAGIAPGPSEKVTSHSHRSMITD
jgi:hypothetical protein